MLIYKFINDLSESCSVLYFFIICNVATKLNYVLPEKKEYEAKVHYLRLVSSHAKNNTGHIFLWYDSMNYRII